MKEEFEYETLTLEDLYILAYHDCICDGDKKKIIVIDKED